MARQFHKGDKAMEKAQLNCKRCLLREMDDRETWQSVRDCIERLPGDRRVPETVYERRLSACRSCDALLAGTCQLCGCYVELRAAIRQQSCPNTPRKRERERSVKP